MATYLKAAETTLQKVLFSDRKYRVPRYQRNYTWTKAEASDFWEDLLNEQSAYFLGTFIFNIEHEAETGFAEIIDGQQRLITVTLFMAALRDIAKSIDPETAGLFQRKDIAIEDKDGVQDYRIVPSDSLVSFLRDNIQKEGRDSSLFQGKTEEETKVEEVYRHFRQKVETLVGNTNYREKKVQLLKDLRNKVYNLIAISVEISDECDAYEIFETTNARGIDLSTSDLLKNMIFKNIPEKDTKDLAKEIWSNIQNNIENTGQSLQRFIRYYWLSKEKFVTEKRMYKDIKQSTVEWDELLESLWTNSKFFNSLVDGSEQQLIEDFPELKHSDRVFNSITALRQMKVSQVFVLLLSVFRNYDQLQTDPVNLIEFLEKFTFQYSIVDKLPTNWLERRYSNYALEIEHEIRSQSSEKHRPGNIQRILNNLKKEFIDELPKFDYFKDQFLEISYKNSEFVRTNIKYIFGKIENHLAETDELSIDYSKINIEHLLPRNPDKEWGFKSKNDIKNYVDLLGNLTIVSTKINSRLQNKIMVKKLPELRKSALQINKDYIELFEQNGQLWGETQIRDRHASLAKLAYDFVWNCS